MFQDVCRMLGLEDIEAKTYLALLEFGPQPAGGLAKKLGIPRSSLYGILRRLQESELVIENLRENVSVFSAEPPERLRLLFRRKREEFDNRAAQLETLLPTLKRKKGGRLLRPRVQLFEGGEGLKGVLKDMLLYRDLKTFALWPIHNMLEILSPEFFRYFNKERILNQLYTRAIWPADQAVDLKAHPYLGVGPEFMREIRIAPEEVSFPMGYWAYGHKAAFISSRSESFGFVIESEEFVQLLGAQFELIWALSVPVPINKAVAKIFMSEIQRYLP